MRNLAYLFLGCVIAISITSCKKDDISTPPKSITAKKTKNYSSKKLSGYFDLLCTCTKTSNGFFPPQASRAYGYTGVTAYEAVVNGIDGAQSLGGQLNGLTSAALPKIETDKNYNWAICSNVAVADIIKKMFGSNLNAANTSSLDSMYNANLAELSIGEDAAVVTRSENFGKAVSQAIYNYSLNDGGDKAYLDPFQLPFQLPPDSFCWVPTGAVLNPLSPKWGNNRPFLAADVENIHLSAPIPYSTVVGSAFYNEAKAVYDQVTSNTSEQVEITKYWADDPFRTCTPTGHTFNILSQLLQEDRATLAKASVAYAKMAVAENDAFISCWKGKYQYVLLRPITYIKRNINPAFTTVIGTPPFPAYTSGHSCEMGAGSRIFTNLFTDGSGNYPFTDYSQLRYGFQPRNFTNFNAMADECALSRFYGGIHYPMDNNKGLQVGRAIGDNVNYMINWPTNIE